MRSWISRHMVALVGTGIGFGVVALVWWLTFGWWLDKLSRQWKWFTEVLIGRWLFPDGINIFHATPLAMLLAAIALIVAWFIMSNPSLGRSRRYDYYGSRTQTEKVTEAKSPVLPRVLLTAGIAMSILFVSFTWAGTNDHASSYAPSTTFVVTDADDVPSSLTRLVEGASSTEDCDLLGDHGMPGCVVEGEFNDDWEPRVASATGAKVVLSRTSGSATNTQLLMDTLTYVYGESGSSAWTAIRDGKGKQSIYGVASWSGQGNVTQCRFDGDFALNQAFHGHWGQNLNDTIAAKFRELFYEESDIWGYCDGEEPIVVIPVKQQVSFAHRTSWRSSGVLVIKGSPSGTPSIEHVTDAKPDDFPGPVYPASLVAEQRDAIGMMAGRINSWVRKFGFEPTDIKTQEGNSSDYLLKSKGDGRLYWVTPMKPRSTDSQLVVAYSVTLADEATNGALNEQRVYVLNDDDPRVVNLDDLEARTRQAVIEANAGFFSGGGKLVEFLPVNGETWQVYAELGGRVVYRITVPSDSRISPTVLPIDSSTETPTEPSEPGTPSVSDCGSDVTKLSDKQLAKCLADFANELQRRQSTK